MKQFLKPSNINDAVNFKEAYPDYPFVSGGTIIFSLPPGEFMDSGISRPAGVIWTGQLDLDSVEITHDGDLRIGAAITLEKLLNYLVQQDNDMPGGCKIGAPGQHSEPDVSAGNIPGCRKVLYQALKGVANRNIRNIATIGGNVALCSSASDLIPALITLDARLELAGLSAESAKNTVSITEFVEEQSQPGSGRYRNNLITHILIPGQPAVRPSEQPSEQPAQFRRCADGARRVSGFEKITRTANDIAVVNVAFAAELTCDSSGANQSGMQLQQVNVAAGCVGPAPKKLYQTERVLEGCNPADPELFEKIRQSLIDHISPADDFRASAQYRKEALAGALTSMIQAIEIEGDLK